MMQLRVQRLAGVPGRALVLAAAALGAGQRLQQLLLVEVLDLAGAEDGVLVLHQRLEVGRRAERAERLGLALQRGVDRRGEDVHVLAVEHEDQEAHDDRDLRDDERSSRTPAVRRDVRASAFEANGHQPSSWYGK